MMDKQAIFCEDQAVTVSAESDDYIDLEVADPNIGEGTPIKLKVQVTDDADFAGGTSIQVELEDSANASSWADVILGKVVALADAVAGKVLFSGYIPDEIRRYIRVYFTVVGTMSAGAVTAWLEY